jgi:hypothetical protein
VSLLQVHYIKLLLINKIKHFYHRYSFLAPSINAVQAAIEYIYPLVYEFRKERSVEEQFALENKKRRFIFTIQETIIGENEEDNENFLVEDVESDNSDTSWS